MQLIRTLSTFLFVCQFMALTAQVHSFKNFGLDKKEFPSRIECINQGVNGELYIGTLAGLVVYDGENFRQITEAEGLGENAVSAIGVKDEFVWIGHWAGSVTIYNAKDASVDVIDLREALNFSSIVCIEPVSKTSGLLVSKEGKVYMYSESGLEQILIEANTANEKVLSIISDSTAYYLITNHGIYKTTVEGSFAVWETIFHTDLELTCASFLQTNQWAVGTTSGGYMLQVDSRELLPIGVGLELGRIVSILQDQEEFLWVGTAEKGVVKYHPITKKIETIKRDNGLSYNQVRTLFMDREGIVWIATVAGLDQYLGQAFILFDRRSGLPENLIWDFAMFQDQFLLATSQSLDLVKISEDNKNVRVIKRFSLNDEEPRKILFKHQGELVYVITAEKNIWYGSIDNGFEKILELNEVAMAVEEVNGEIWVGTTKGIFKVSKGKLLEQYTEDTGLGGDKVNGIYYSKVRNETWITVLGGPCTLYKDGRFKKYGLEAGLTSSVIQDAAFDKKGYPWFATYDDGVIYFNGNEFKNLSEKVSLSSTTTFAIEIDENESVWIGHNWGLDLYRIPFEDVSRFGKDQGFMGMEVNSGAIHSDGNKNIVMCTLMGLLRFTPSSFRTNIIEPITIIKSIRVGDKSLTADENDVSIDFGKSDLKIEFSGISLVNPDQNRYEYRLLGAHESWKTKLDQSPIEYLSLPPGNFTFELRTCNSSGFCNKNPVSFSFTITPPFYRTWWFYTLIFLLVVLAIFLMDRYRVLVLIDEKNQLSERLSVYEQQLIERTQYAEELKQQIDYNDILYDQLIQTDKPKRLVSLTLPKDDLSADQIIEMDFNSFQVYGLIDLGVSGLIGKFLMERIKLEFTGAIQRINNITPNLVISALDELISAQLNKLDKHKEAGWVILIKDNDSLKVHNRLLSYFVMDANEVVEIKAAVDKTNFVMETIDFSSRIFASSDGVIEQLSADGTKTYGKRRLHAKLSDSVSLDSNSILKIIQDDIRAWQGAMEQSDDICLIIWEP